MLRRLSFSSFHDILSSGTCNPQADNQAQLDSPHSSLVYYTAIARGTDILSEYTAEGNTDLPAIAAACLENVPSLHSRFSYTTNQRRFICLLDGVATYCAIMDESLSKTDAYSFLQQVRDAFSAFGKGRGMSLTLGAHFLDDAMSSIMGNLAASFVGIPQRERDRIQAEPWADSGIAFDADVSCPSASVPLRDVCAHGCDLSTSKEGCVGTRTPRLPLMMTGTVRKGKSKMKEQGKDVPANKERKTGGGNEVVVGGGLRAASEGNLYIDTQKICQRKVSIAAHWVLMYAHFTK